MAACTSCGEDNPSRARFCLGCGTALQQAAPTTRTTRKTVTVLFSDLAGSTSMGERLDPESLQRIMARYFDEMRAIIERHGGTVAKFIGDAVMSVFGIPNVREDDALRAVRASAEMRSVMFELNEELERTWGVRLRVRTGVNTGEILAQGLTGEEGLALGDCVNVAARLEQAAPEGEVLLGPVTYRLVRDAVRVEAMEPLAVKGKSELLPAVRLLEVLSGAAPLARHLDSPMIGRADELAALRAAYERCVAEQSCQLFTVIGAAGMGKSRLALELLEDLHHEATVLTGRCLSYGEGITFWPVAEMVRQATLLAEGDSPEHGREKLIAALGDDVDRDVVADLVAQVIGLSPPTAELEELFWGVRLFLRTLARARPLVVVVDDLHWAQPTLLDLLGGFAEGTFDGPMLVLCTGRHELFDVRPGWQLDGDQAASGSLEPLSPVESRALLSNLLDRTQLPPQVEERILEAAEGVPLFLEELLGVLIDDGSLRLVDGAWVPATDLQTVPIPPTIAALVAARLDLLASDERTVLDCGAVAGKVFSTSSVRALSAGALGSDLERHLATLVNRELVLTDRSSFVGHDAYRFRHLLIRDTAYVALPKEDRARLHQALASWIEEVTGERVTEYEGIVGYHLEQAVRMRAELAPATDQDRAIARQAAAWLGAAGRRALAQEDVDVARGLLERAATLLPDDDEARLENLLALGDALVGSGDLVAAEAVLTEQVERAKRSGRERLAAHGVVALAVLARSLHPEEASQDQEIGSAIETFRRASDEHGLALAHLALARPRWDQGRSVLADDLARTALDHARRAEDPKMVTRLLGNLALSAALGPTSTSLALSLCAEYAAELKGRRVGEARLAEAQAMLLAMRGRFDEARALIIRARTVYLDLRMVVNTGILAQFSGEVERLASDDAAAEAALEEGFRVLGALGERSYRATIAAQLAHVICAQGRGAEAEAYARLAETEAAEDDVVSQAWASSARAKTLAARGELGAAERLGRAAVHRLEDTDWRNDQADALTDLGDVMLAGGDRSEAAACFERALALYGAKENLIGVGRARQRLASLPY